jgi:hypothetical protein
VGRLLVLGCVGLRVTHHTGLIQTVGQVSSSGLCYGFSVKFWAKSRDWGQPCETHLRLVHLLDDEVILVRLGPALRRVKGLGGRRDSRRGQNRAKKVALQGVQERLWRGDGGRRGLQGGQKP